MRAHATCHLTGSQEQFTLGLGDLIGRSEQAALCIDDPRISEAHALVSLRGRTLMLLALRGRFRVSGEVRSEVALKAGMAIELHKEFWLHCDEVVLPPSLPGLSISGLPRTLLTHTTSLFLGAVASIQPGYDAKADVVFWTLGDTWSYRVHDGPVQAFVVGKSIQVADTVVECVAVPISDAQIAKTKQTNRLPLNLEVGPVSVRIQVKANTSSVLTGIPGKILSAVARQSHPQTWEHIAQQVWSDDLSMSSSLRRRFDVGLLRLRDKLQQLGLPSDLIQMDGSGLVSLKLDRDDQIVLSGAPAPL